MNKLPTRGNESEVTSAIHMEFIQNLAEQQKGDGEEALEVVESYHRSIFLNHYGQDIERFQQQRRTHEDRLSYLEQRLAAANEKLVGRDKLIAVNENGKPDVEPTSPWNVWDRGMFTASLLGVALLLVFGIFNISFNLLESGIVTFLDHPARAYFWAALLPVGALGAKVGWDFLRSQALRIVYIWTCLGLGMAGVLVWVAAYASVYPSLSTTTDEQIQSLSVFDQGGADGGAMSGLTFGGAKKIDMIIVSAQAVAEIFLSAVLGIYMTMIYMRHRPVRLAPNPEFTQLEKDRQNLENRIEQERLALASAKGGESKLQHQLSVFVEFSKSLFQKEILLRRDKNHQERLILEHLSEQIRDKLAETEPKSSNSKFEMPRSVALNNGGSR